MPVLRDCLMGVKVLIFHPLNASVAQLAERVLAMDEVDGSKPF